MSRRIRTGIFRRTLSPHRSADADPGDDAEVVLTPESFRTNVPWTSDQHAYVTLAKDPQTTSVSVTLRYCLLPSSNEASHDASSDTSGEASSLSQSSCAC